MEEDKVGREVDNNLTSSSDMSGSASNFERIRHLREAHLERTKLVEKVAVLRSFFKTKVFIFSIRSVGVRLY